MEGNWSEHLKKWEIIRVFTNGIFWQSHGAIVIHVSRNSPWLDEFDIIAFLTKSSFVLKSGL